MSEFFKPKKLETKTSVAEAEKLFDFYEWDLQGEWLKISTPNGKTVEGAYYKSEKSNGEVVIFHPGLPGDTVGRFEEDFVAQLLDQGHDVFVARHNGLKIQESNKNLYHNQHRINQNKNISGEPIDWFDEPRASINYFAQQDKDIILITHSFSGTAAANSLIEMNKDEAEKKLTQKIKKWILLSATIWNISDDGILDPNRKLDLEDMKNYWEYCAQQYAMSSEYGATQLVEKTKKVLETINSMTDDSISKDIEVVGVYPENDKIISPSVGINFINKLPRGIILRDHFIPTDENEDPHDFKHAQANDLIRIIKMKTSKSKHVFDINK